MLHFLSGIPRLIFLTAPLAFLLLHAYIIYAPALMIALFVLPHMIHASLTNSKIQGKYRHSFWSEIYETVLAWYIAPPTFVALINPHKGKFNVTAKGGLVEDEYVDWVISRPYIYLVLLNLVGVGVGIWRFMYGPENEILTVWVSIIWVFYNLIILGGAVAVSRLRASRCGDRTAWRCRCQRRLPAMTGTCSPVPSMITPTAASASRFTARRRCWKVSTSSCC